MDQGNDWTWLAFEVAMGERTGQYVFGTFNHAMADFDSPPVEEPVNEVLDPPLAANDVIL